jgi:hypothetical protein
MGSIWSERWYDIGRIHWIFQGTGKSFFLFRLWIVCFSENINWCQIRFHRERIWYIVSILIVEEIKQKIWNESMYWSRLFAYLEVFLFILQDNWTVWTNNKNKDSSSCSFSSIGYVMWRSWRKWGYRCSLYKIYV